MLHPLRDSKFQKLVQGVPKDAVEQSYFGKIMIGHHWGSLERLEVAGPDFCTFGPLF